MSPRDVPFRVLTGTSYLGTSRRFAMSSRPDLFAVARIMSAWEAGGVTPGICGESSESQSAAPQSEREVLINIIR